MKNINKRINIDSTSNNKKANNIIRLYIRYVAKCIGKEGKFSWAVIDRKTSKPLDNWATTNLKEHIAKQMAKRLNLELIHKLNS